VTRPVGPPVGMPGAPAAAVGEGSAHTGRP
jgi:hypothetical protein